MQARTALTAALLYVTQQAMRVDWRQEPLLKLVKQKDLSIAQQPLNPSSLITTSLDYFCSPISFTNMTKNFTLFAVPKVCVLYSENYCWENL
jgi:hypothetical protein